MPLNLTLTYALHLLLWMGAGYIVYQKTKESPIRPFILPALVFKLFATIAIGLIYKYHYEAQGDIFGFYELGKTLADLPPAEHLRQVFLTSIPYDQRSVLPMVKISSLILRFTAQDFWLASCYFSLFSFSCATYLTHQLAMLHRSLRLPACLAFLFYPSVVFWSSGMLKESIVFGLLTFMSGVYVQAGLRSRPNAVLLVALPPAGWLILLLKYYIAAAFIPLLIWLGTIALLQKYAPGWKTQKRYYVFLLGIVLIVGYWASQAQYNLAPTRISQIIHQHQEEILQITPPENRIYYDPPQTWAHSLLNIARAVFAGLFRPLLPATSWLQMLASAENMTLVLLALWSIKYHKNITTGNNLILMSIAAYVVTLAALLAYASPSLGTLVRYKVYYMPILLLYILYNHPLLFLFQKKTPP